MIASLLLLSCQQAAPQLAMPVVQNPSQPRPSGGCISAADEALAQAAIRSYVSTYGPLSTPTAGRAGPVFPQFPVGGNLLGGSIDVADIMVFNYMDHDPNSGWQDWDCTAVTFDGHPGTDVAIRGFDEQDRGVPIYAVLEGVVVTIEDGHFDRHTTWVPGAIANSVMVDHGGGMLVRYISMKNGSVAVAVNDVVVAGQVLGMVGSSGLSIWPHLHLDIKENSVFRDPYSGPCNPVGSLWAQQDPIPRGMEILLDMISNENPLISGGLPNPIPRTGSIDFNDSTLGYAVGGNNLPVNSYYQVRVLRPSGTVEYDSGTQPLVPTIMSTPTIWFWYLALDIATHVPAMQSITGTWGFEFWINGTLLRDLDVEVMAVRPPGYNRPPEPIQVSFDPPAPMSDDVVACRVTSAAISDLDFDVLRYRYQWTVDGVVVRDVTLGGSADMLPRGTAASGQSVQCAVSVGDDDGFLAPKVVGALINGGMHLSAANPGLAGQLNTLTVEQAPPNGRVHFVYGFQLGTTTAPVCPGMTSAIQSPILAASRVADANGSAQLTAPVPSGLAGTQIYLQAFNLSTCRKSNLLGTIFL